MRASSQRGLATIGFVVITTFLVVNFLLVSLSIHLRQQTALTDALDSEIAASRPCQQSVMSWLSTEECLPPLGDYYHARLVPDAICAWLDDQSWQWRGMRCATP